MTRPLLTDRERETIATGMAEAAKGVCIYGLLIVAILAGATCC